VTTLPPSLPGIPFNSATISNAIGYARRASLALLPLPRHIGGFTSSSIPSPVSTVPSENLSPGLVRRGSVPAWSGSSLSNGNNGSSNGVSGLNPESKNPSSNLAMGNGSSSLSVSSVPISSSSSSLSGKNSIVNGHGHNHIHTNGVSTTPHGTPTTELSKRGSWVMVNNNLSNHGLYNHNNHGQHHNSHSNHHNHQHNNQHLQSHGHGNASRSSSSDSCHSYSTTGSNSGTAPSTSIPVSRMTTNGDENSNINGTDGMDKSQES
jgi:hypothetical protein